MKSFTIRELIEQSLTMSWDKQAREHPQVFHPFPWRYGDCLEIRGMAGVCERCERFMAPRRRKKGEDACD